MITAAQIKKLKVTGKVADVEDGGMDEGRFFVHLTESYSWDEGYGIQRTKSFGRYSDVVRALKTIIAT